MVSRKQHVLNTRRVTFGVFLAAAFTLLVQAQSISRGSKKFYPDDPLWREPEPRATAKVTTRKVDDLYDFVENRFVTPRVQENVRKEGPIPASNINTLGEVPDSNWYANRHWRKRMPVAELRRGAGNTTPPDPKGMWQVISAKSDGISPGFVIEDQQKNRYVLKFDPPDFPELASAADVISSKFFYALGYNTPEDYIVRFSRENLTIGKDVMWRDASGKKRPLTQRVIDKMLELQPKDSSGGYRALASRWIGGDLVGPFNYKGTRSDDPNDIVPHENRRELRGLRVFASWLNHTDVKQMNTMDAMVTENGRRYLKHYLMDFGSTLGSDGNTQKNPWRGHVYPISPKTGLVQTVTLGFYIPHWMRANYPKLQGVGAFEGDTFDPESWIPDYPNPAFLMMDDDDAFWAAKQIIRFSDEDIRAIVETGEFTDRRAVDWITESIIKRRDQIARTWLSKSLPLDEFRVEGGSLVFEDLSSKYHLFQPRTYEVHWSSYDNDHGNLQPLPNATGWNVPAPGGGAGYLAAVIQCTAAGAPCHKPVTVYVRLNGARFEVVGVDRQAR